MTVKELIEALSKMPQDLKVEYDLEYGDQEVEYVRVRKVWEAEPATVVLS